MRTLEKHTLGFGECTIKGGLESTGLEKGPVKGLCNRYIPQTRISDTTLAAAIGRYMKLASLLQCNLLNFFLCDTWEMPSRKVPFSDPLLSFHCPNSVVNYVPGTRYRA